jgi:tetratricopeptide (TPR) repeat protein
MMHLSMVYGDLKELELSDQLGNESIALTRKFDAENAEELSRTLFSRATTLCKAGRFDEAKVYADESIQVLIKKNGGKDWRLGRNLSLLAEIESARNRLDLSLVHQRNALELITPRFGLNHPTVTQAQQKLAETLYAIATETQSPNTMAHTNDANMLDEAIKYAQFAVDGRRHEGNFPRNLGVSLALLSKLNKLKGDIETSIILESEIIALLRERAPQAAEEIANAQIRLAELQAMQAAQKIPALAPTLAPAPAPAKTP